MVRKAVTEAGKKIVATTAKRAGGLAGEKIVSGIDKLANKRKKRPNITFNAGSQSIIKTLTQPNNPNVSISNILEGLGQAIAIEQMARKVNRWL